LTTIVEYTSVELPVGLRHYFFLNENSKLFINASYIADISFNSSFSFKRKDGFDLSPFEINSVANFTYGLGYKYNDKISLEIRHQNTRDLLTEKTSASSNYKSISIIFGYSLF